MKFIYVTLFIFFVVSVKGQKPDAEYLLLEKNYTINNDGTYKVNYKHRLKYYSYLSINRLYGETFISYNLDFQKLVINKCYTTRPDGSVVNAPKNAFNKMLPNFAAHSGTYNDIREMVVTHIGLERGVVVTLDYSLISKENKLGFLSGTEPTKFEMPCKKLIYRFTTPKDYPLNFSGNTGVYSKKIINDSIVYTFSYSNLSAQSKLKFAAKDLSVLHFSDGNTFTKQLSALLASFGEVSVDLNKVKFDEVKKIYENYLNKIRLINVPIKFQKIPLPDNSNILSENSGSLLEIAKVFIYELNKQNVKSQLVLSVPKYKFNYDSTSIYDINGVYVRVMISNIGSVLISMKKSDDINLNKTDLSNTYITWAKNKWSVMKNKDVNQVNALCNVNLTDLKFDLSFDYSGCFCELNKPKISILNDSATVLKNGKYKNSGSLNVKSFGDFNSVNLPVLIDGVAKLLDLQLPQNASYNIELKQLVKQNFEYNVTYSKKISLVRLPKDILIDNKYFRIYCMVLKKENKVNIKQDVELKSLVIPKEYYQKLRGVVSYIQDENNFKIIYIKK